MKITKCYNMYVIKLYTLFINSCFHIIGYTWQLFVCVRQPNVDPLLPNFATTIVVLIIYNFASCQIEQLHFKSTLNRVLLVIRGSHAPRLDQDKFHQLLPVKYNFNMPNISRKRALIHYLFKWFYYVNYFKKLVRKK